MKHQPRCLTACVFALLPVFAACSGSELDPNQADAGEVGSNSGDDSGVTFPGADADPSDSENSASSAASSAEEGSTDGASSANPGATSAGTGAEDGTSTGTNGATETPSTEDSPSSDGSTTGASTDATPSGSASDPSAGSDPTSGSQSPSAGTSTGHGSSAPSSDVSQDSNGETSVGAGTISSGENGSSGETVPALPPCAPPHDEDDVDAGAAFALDAGTGTDGGPHDVRSDLVLLLEMDEPSFNDTALVLDSSGLDNHGTPRGSGATPAEGRFGGGAAFDGMGWFSIPDSVSFEATTGLTLSAWVKFDQFVPTEAPGIIAKRWGFGIESAFALFVWDENRVWLDVDSENDRFCSRQTLAADTWYHLAVVFDGTLPESRRVKIYVNGRLDSVARETSTTVPSNDAPIEVGRLVNGGQNLYGTLDEVAVWTRALSPSEAHALPHLDL